MIKTKKIMLAIAMTAILSNYGNIYSYAEDIDTTYKSNIQVKNYDELTDELGKALSKGSTDVVIGIEENLINDFYSLNQNRFEKLINEARYKSKNDYYINEMGKYSYRGISKNEVNFQFSYLETPAETKMVEDEVKRIIEDIIKPNMSEEEKVKVIHDYIVTHVQYDVNGLKSGTEAHTAYAGLFTDKTGEPHETVCQGYALLFYKMATEAGLEARIMTGNSFSKSANQKPQPHAWNLIKINKNWYQIDLTWDDPVMNPPNPDYKRYDYFNLSDDEMKNDHTYNDPDKFPKCDTLYKDVATNEFILNEIGRSEANKILSAESKDELKKVLLSEVENSKAETQIKYKGNIEDISEAVSELMRKGILKTFGPISYTTGKDSRTFMIKLDLSNKVTELRVSKYKYDLILNEPQEFEIIAKLENGQEDKITSKANIMCSDKTIVSINKENLQIVGKKKGQATIKIKYGGIEKEVLINVEERKKSSDATVSMITVGNHRLENFDKNIFKYTVKVNNINEIPKVSATLSDSKSKIEINQATNLEGNDLEKRAIIKVTAEDGTINEYKVLLDIKEAQRQEAEKKAKELEEAQRQEAEKKAKELEEAQRQEAEKKAKELEEAQRQEAEKKAKELEEAQRQEAEKKAKALEEAQRQEAEKKVKALEEAQREEAEKKAKELEEAQRQEAEKKAKELEEAQRQEAEKKAKELEEAQKQEAEKKAKELEEAQKQEAQKKELTKNNRRSSTYNRHKRYRREETNKSEAITNSDLTKVSQENFIKQDQNVYEKNEFVSSILNIKEAKSNEVVNARRIIAKAFKEEKIQFWGNPNKNHKTELNHNFKINFNKKVSADDLKSKIVIFNKYTGDKVDIKVEVVNNGRTIIVNKNENFNVNDKYVLFISDDLKDSGNNSALNKVIIMEIDC